jgi:hypothetical protein
MGAKTVAFLGLKLHQALHRLRRLTTSSIVRELQPQN